MKIARLHLYPFLFAAYPILFLIYENLGTVRVSQGVFPISVAVSLAALIWFLSYAFGRSAVRASLITGMVVLLLACFKPAVDLGVERAIFQRGAESSGGVLSVFGGVLVVAVCMVARFWKKLGWLHVLLNFTSIVLTGMLGASIIQGVYSEDAKGRRLFVPAPVSLTSSPEFGRPDIYYIILDGYGRSDILKDIYGYDNSPFLDELRSLGFFIADESRSNYAQTLLSLGSSLNMMYLDQIASVVGERSGNRAPIKRMVGDNIVANSLISAGYRFVSFSSGYEGTTMRKGEMIRPSFLELSEFDNLVVRQSPFPAIADALALSGARSAQFESHRHRVAAIIEKLPKVARPEHPDFVVAHILSPHPPFVFGPRGEHLNPDRSFNFDDGSHFTSKGSVEEYVRGYAGQAEYISGEILKSIKAIVASDPGAIIILQGDHGPGGHLNWKSLVKSNMKERMRILNAYRVPAPVKERLYAGVTPVNTFRILFSTLFGADLKPLPDESYFSRFPLPYSFKNVTAYDSDGVATNGQS